VSEKEPGVCATDRRAWRRGIVAVRQRTGQRSTLRVTVIPQSPHVHASRLVRAGHVSARGAADGAAVLSVLGKHGALRLAPMRAPDTKHAPEDGAKGKT
jgi:hypothetical protein